MGEMIFKGFKQVLLSTYTDTPQSEKIGYVWFVRESADSVYGDIYLGSRHYGHFGTEAEDIQAINDILAEAGIVDASGNTVDIASLIEDAQLTEGNGIEIKDGVINSNAEGTTTSDITIAGGAINASGLWDGDVIPEGTSVQDILIKLLCKEMFPNAASKPTITASVSGTAVSGLKEVGSTVTVNGFTSSTQNGKFNADYTNVSQPDINTSWSDIVYTTSKTGFTEYTVATSAATIDSQSDITVVKGTNKVTVKVVGTYDAPDTTPISNLKNDATDAAYTYPSGTASGTTSITVTGVYPIYVNGVSASTTDATAAAMANLETVSANDDTVASYKMPLVNTGTAFAVSFAKMVSAPYRILLPQGQYTIKSAQAINGLTGKFENDCKALFVKNGTEEKVSGSSTITYDVYEYNGSEGANRVKFVLQ